MKRAMVGTRGERRRAAHLHSVSRRGSKPCVGVGFVSCVILLAASGQMDSVRLPTLTEGVMQDGGRS
jgi:hypothetical protein